LSTTNNSPRNAASPTPQGEARLDRLATRSESLLEDLDGARGDLLSVGDLNRTLKQVLRNQVAILRTLATFTPGTGAGDTAQAAASSILELVAPASHDSSEAEELSEADYAPLEEALEEALEEVLEETPQEEASQEEAPEEEPSRGSSESLANEVLGVTKSVRSFLARTVVAAFDHRDQDYNQGLEKLNRWTDGGGGTPFQLRGERAYLNVSGSGAEGVQGYELNIMKRMGFVRRLGRLDVPGLVGEVVIYERP
jgi:hypothetical protein